MAYEDDLPNSEPFFTVGDNGSRYAEMNKGVTPVFFMKLDENPAKSAIEGRPMFDEVLLCKILVAGDPENAHVAPVDSAIKERFPDQYRKWVDSKVERHISGTPLRQWPLMTPMKIAEFEALHIFNVEGLRDLAEANFVKAPDLRAWQAKAKAWLETAKDGAAAMQYAAENLELKGEMAELKKQLAELTSRIDDERPRGPGRPRNAA